MKDPTSDAMQSPPDEVAELRRLIDEARPNSIVFFGGAGVSTESGIPDFRSPDGLYAQKYKYPPETIISRSFFDRNPKDFYDFYFDRVVFKGAKPNAAHEKLSELERDGRLISVITQNIDGLHQLAGSNNVRELHGSIQRNACMSCGARYDLEQLLSLREDALRDDGDGIPRCSHCGGIVKPDVVLYEEPLDGDVIEQSIADISKADLLIVAGTSLVVNPAASLIRFFQGDTLAIVNLSPTPADSSADILISRPIGEVFSF